MAGAGQDLRQLVIDGLSQGYPVSEISERVTRLRDRRRIGVDGDEAEARMRGQQGARMASAAKGRIHQHSARQVQRRPEQLENPVAHDRQVSGSSRSHHAPSIAAHSPAAQCVLGRPAAEMPGQAPIRATALTGHGHRLTPGK